MEWVFSSRCRIVSVGDDNNNIIAIEWVGRETHTRASCRYSRPGRKRDQWKMVRIQCSLRVALEIHFLLLATAKEQHSKAQNMLVSERGHCRVAKEKSKKGFKRDRGWRELDTEFLETLPYLIDLFALPSPIVTPNDVIGDTIDS